MLLLGVLDSFVQHLTRIGTVMVAYHHVRFIILYLYTYNLFCLVVNVENFTYYIYLVALGLETYYNKIHSTNKTI